MIENLTVEGALEFAIETERIGSEVYRRLAEKHRGEPELKKLFDRLADDEKQHQAKLGELGRTLGEGRRREPTQEEQDYLRSVSWNEIFHGDRDPVAAAEKIESREDALEMAYDLERSSLIFYDACRDLLGEEPILEEVIRMEKHHLTQITKYMMDSGMKFRGAGDSWT